MTSRTRRSAQLATAVLGVALMSACSVSVNLTGPASEIAAQAADALNAEHGWEITVDCGDGSVDLVDGTKVNCIASDPATGKEFDAEVTLSDVQGTNFHLSVELVAER